MIFGLGFACGAGRGVQEFHEFLVIGTAGEVQADHLKPAPREIVTGCQGQRQAGDELSFATI